MKFAHDGAYTLLFAAIVLADRASKHLALQLQHAYEVAPFLSFQKAFNKGISWGLLHDVAYPLVEIILKIGIAVIIALLMRYIYLRYRSGYSVYAEIAVLAGAVSNFFDRLQHGAVIDFIHLHVGRHSFPIFNLADVAIVLGTCWMIIAFYREDHA
jgi:lipoprotein signal peptidase